MNKSVLFRQINNKHVVFCLKISASRICVIKTKDSDRHPSAYRSFTVISAEIICKADYINSLQTVSGA